MTRNPITYTQTILITKQSAACIPGSGRSRLGRPSTCSKSGKGIIGQERDSRRRRRGIRSAAERIDSAARSAVPLGARQTPLPFYFSEKRTLRNGIFCPSPGGLARIPRHPVINHRPVCWCTHRSATGLPQPAVAATPRPPPAREAASASAHCL